MTAVEDFERHIREETFRRDINLPVAQHDIRALTQYVLIMMSYRSHYMMTLTDALLTLEDHPSAEGFDKEYFLEKFTKWCRINDIIKDGLAIELFEFDLKCLAHSGRNYLMVDVIRAFESTLRAWAVK